MFTEDQFDEVMRLTYEFNEPFNLGVLRRWRKLDMRLLKRYLDAGRALREAFDGIDLSFITLPPGRYGCEAGLAIHLHPTEEVIFVVMDEGADHEGLGFAPWTTLAPGEHKRQATRWFDNAPDALRDYLTLVQRPLAARMVENRLVEAMLKEWAGAFGKPSSIPVSRLLPDGTLVYRGGVYNTASFPLVGGLLARDLPTEELHAMNERDEREAREALARREREESEP